MQFLPPKTDYKFNDTQPVEDSKAKKEQEALYRGDKRRGEREKNSMHWISVILIWSLGLFAAAVLSLRILHLVLPNGKQWMTAEQIQTIDKIFFSGTIGGILTSRIKKAYE